MSRRRAIAWALIAIVLARTAFGEKADIPDDALVLRVGATMAVAFTESGNSLIRPRVIEPPAREPAAVVIELTESGRAATLAVTHGYTKTLHFRAVARMRGRRRQFELPVTPVPPGTQSSWTMTDPFHELALFDFRLSDSH